MGNLFETPDGNMVESFDTVYETISGITFDGREVHLAFTTQFDFRGEVGTREIYNLHRPEYRKGHAMSQEDLFTALDAAVSFCDSADEHEARHGCENAFSCEG